MLPLILGAVALGTVGYGVKKCLVDEDCIDNIKDKIQDGAIKAYEGIEALEDKMGMSEYSFNQDEIDSSPMLKGILNYSNAKRIQDKFDSLYNLKLEILEKLNALKLIKIDKLKVKKDKVIDDTFTQQMMLNLSSYVYLLQTTYDKIEYAQNQKEDTQQYQEIIKNLFTTKIIKKGKLNDNSTQAILNATLTMMDMPHITSENIESELSV